MIASAGKTAPGRLSLVANEPKTCVEYVDAVMKAVTADGTSQRALRSVRVERAVAPVRRTTVNAVTVAAGTDVGGSDSAELLRSDLDVDITLTQSHSAEIQAQTQQSPMTDPDPRDQPQIVCGVQFSAPVSFDDVLPEAFRDIAPMPWFSSRVVLADDEWVFAALERCAWNGVCFWGVVFDAL